MTAHNRTGTSTATVTSDTVYGPLGDIAITGLTGQGPYAAFTVAVDPRGLSAAVTITVRADGALVKVISASTGSGAFSTDYNVKVGFGKAVRVNAYARRGGESSSDQATTTTGSGTVTVTSHDASSCSGAPCTTKAVTITVDNLAFSRSITCSIRAGGSTWGGITFSTDSSGHAAYDVPESDFVATSGTGYTFTCDDNGTPDAPVTRDWTAP